VQLIILSEVIIWLIVIVVSLKGIEEIVYVVVDMGLDISVDHGDYSFRAGSYSGFHMWRNWLASIAGIDLDDMTGFGGRTSWEPDTPFRELLFHSDCDGYLGLRDCRNLKKDFEQFYLDALLKMNDKEEGGYDLTRYECWYKAVCMVVNGFGKRLIFC
jgi:hypothetical protein